MADKPLDIAYFIAFCIEQYKHRHGLCGSEVMDLFDKYQVGAFLEENYEVLHTQGPRWLMEEIEEYIEYWKKKIV